LVAAGVLRFDRLAPDPEHLGGVAAAAVGGDRVGPVADTGELRAVGGRDRDGALAARDQLVAELRDGAVSLIRMQVSLDPPPLVDVPPPSPTTCCARTYARSSAVARSIRSRARSPRSPESERNPG